MEVSGDPGAQFGGLASISSLGQRATGTPLLTGSTGRSRTRRIDAKSPTPGEPTPSNITPTRSGPDSSSRSSLSAACSVSNCGATATKRGLCGRHYQRLLKTGDPLGVKPGRWDGYTRPTCSVPECASPAHAHGLCAVHVKRAERHGDVRGGRRQRGQPSLIVWRFSSPDGKRANAGRGTPPRSPLAMARSRSWASECMRTERHGRW